MDRAGHSQEEHVGELALRLEADSLGGLFVEAGRALAEVLAGEVPRATGDALRVSLRARDRDALLVDWLNELIFLAETERRVFSEFTVERISDRALDAEVRGAALPGELRTPVKAATFHGLRIEDAGGRLAATVVLDV